MTPDEPPRPVRRHPPDDAAESCVGLFERVRPAAAAAVDAAQTAFEGPAATSRRAVPVGGATRARLSPLPIGVHPMIECGFP